MIDRRFVTTVLVLSVLALASQVLVWLTRPRPAEPDFTGPPRSGYTLDDFTLHALDENGKLTFTVSGPRLVRRSEDGSIFVSTPDYIMVDSEGHPWTGTSESAWVNRDGSLMQLEGRVDMQRTPSPGVAAARITTSELLVRPKDRTLETAAAAQISQPGSILRGTGLRGDLNSKVLELLSDVHNTFEPRKRTR
ncbi:MAG: LPS export ABC transporter periplasmic protein LptC [Xanthomonadales bacterium]|nr:LPS export ABC transporter periplasmic protein LptC [Xanthomonadales bacterium]